MERGKEMKRPARDQTCDPLRPPALVNTPPVLVNTPPQKVSHHGAETMALLVSLCSLAACREGWTSLGSRCVYQTAGDKAESACAADCASVARPWIANDTGGVPMCIRSQGEHDFLHTWVGREYWTGFRRNGASDGVTPPDDWRTGLVHPQGSACSAGANPWFDSLMSHQGAWPLLERAR